jgi:DNA repair protein RadC
MKDIPVTERPYEKLEVSGPEMLSNAELLAIIIKSGCKEETSVALAQKVLLKCGENKGVASLYNLSLEEFKSIKGIGRVKAIQIMAVLELSKRISSSNALDDKISVKSPGDVSKLLMESMRYLKKEVFKLLMLDTKNHIIRQVDVSVGSLNSSIVHPREVFNPAIKACCSSVLLVHNHPSGDPEPSSEDVETTRRLVAAGDILGIKILDHIIIGDGRIISFKERSLI